MRIGDLKHFDDFVTKLSALAEYTSAMPGMDPARVDLMPYSAALIQWVLGHGCIQEICRAPYALREGVLSRIERGLPLLPSLS